jgi:broad specificity phosphatase PhoE
MTTLVLVKHAAPEIQPSVPSPQWRLSERGLRQCEDLALRLAPYAPRVVYCSTEPKARQTAERVARIRGLSAITRPRLHENDRAGLGFITDQEELRSRFREFFANPDSHVIGNETANQARERFRQAVRDVVAEADADPAVIISHGTVITLLLARPNQLGEFDFWSELELTGFVAVRSASLEILARSRPTRV